MYYVLYECIRYYIARLLFNSLHLVWNLYIFFFCFVMPPTLKKLVGHVAFGACVCGSHFLVPTLTFKPFKLES